MAALFASATLLGLKEPEKLLCLEVQQPWATMLLQGEKTVETRRYPLPEWAKGAEVVILDPGYVSAGVSSLGDRPRAGAASLLGVVVFSECVSYASEEAWNADVSRHRIGSGGAYAWDGTERFGWDEEV